MLGKFLCFAGGTIFGVFIMCVMAIAKDEDERMDKDKWTSITYPQICKRPELYNAVQVFIHLL